MALEVPVAKNLLHLEAEHAVAARRSLCAGRIRKEARNWSVWEENGDGHESDCEDVGEEQ